MAHPSPTQASSPPFLRICKPQSPVFWHFCGRRHRLPCESEGMGAVAFRRQNQKRGCPLPWGPTVLRTESSLHRRPLRRSPCCPGSSPCMLLCGSSVPPPRLSSEVSLAHGTVTARPPQHPSASPAPCLDLPYLDGLHGAHDHHRFGHASAQAAEQTARAVQPSLGVPHVVAEELEHPEPAGGRRGGGGGQPLGAPSRGRPSPPHLTAALGMEP